MLFDTKLVMNEPWSTECKAEHDGSKLASSMSSVRAFFVGGLRFDFHSLIQQNLTFAVGFDQARQPIPPEQMYDRTTPRTPSF